MNTFEAYRRESPAPILPRGQETSPTNDRERDGQHLRRELGFLQEEMRILMEDALETQRDLNELATLVEKLPLFERLTLPLRFDDTAERVRIAKADAEEIRENLIGLEREQQEIKARLRGTLGKAKDLYG